MFGITHEVAVRNIKILAAFKDDLGGSIAVHKDISVNSGSEFRDITTLEKLFPHQVDKAKVINIIHQVSSYHLDPIEEEARKSVLDEMIIRGNHKSSHSVLNSVGLYKSISKEIDHGRALLLTI